MEASWEGRADGRRGRCRGVRYRGVEGKERSDGGLGSAGLGHEMPLDLGGGDGARRALRFCKTPRWEAGNVVFAGPLIVTFCKTPPGRKEHMAKSNWQIRNRPGRRRGEFGVLRTEDMRVAVLRWRRFLDSCVCRLRTFNSCQAGRISGGQEWNAAGAGTSGTRERGNKGTRGGVAFGEGCVGECGWYGVGIPPTAKVFRVCVWRDPKLGRGRDEATERLRGLKERTRSRGIPWFGRGVDLRELCVTQCSSPITGTWRLGTQGESGRWTWFSCVACPSTTLVGEGTLRQALCAVRAGVALRERRGRGDEWGGKRDMA